VLTSLHLHHGSLGADGGGVIPQDAEAALAAPAYARKMLLQIPLALGNRHP